MIIPIRCFTCNKIIASKYNKFLELKKYTLEELLDFNFPTEESKQNFIETNKFLDDKNLKMKLIFKNIGVNRYCCKRHLISHIDLIKEI